MKDKKNNTPAKPSKTPETKPTDKSKKWIALGAAVMLMSASAAMANDSTAHAQAKADYYFDKIDTNHDGVISKDEHDKFSSDMFSKADTNNDGVISKDEMVAAKKKEMSEMHAAMKSSKSTTTK